VRRMVYVADAAAIEERMNARLVGLSTKLAPELARLLASRPPGGEWTDALDAAWAALVDEEADAILRQAKAELHAACESGSSGTA